MGVKIWILQDAESGEYWMVDRELHYNKQSGPIEISPELFERIREAEREFQWMQDTLETLDYDWQYSDDDTELDCD